MSESRFFKKPHKFSSLKVQAADALVKAMANALRYSSLGLSTTGNISQKNSLYMAGTVEFVATTLGFIIFLHELISLLLKGRCSPKHSLYLTFSLAFIAISYIGAALVTHSAATDREDTPEALIGLLLIALSTLGEAGIRAGSPKELSPKRAKSLDIEMGKEKAEEEDEEEKEDEEKEMTPLRNS